MVSKHLANLAVEAKCDAITVCLSVIVAVVATWMPNVIIIPLH
jgi:hypothetical protein